MCALDLLVFFFSWSLGRKEMFSRVSLATRALRSAAQQVSLHSLCTWRHVSCGLRFPSPASLSPGAPQSAVVLMKEVGKSGKREWVFGKGKKEREGEEMCGVQEQHQRNVGAMSEDSSSWTTWLFVFHRLSLGGKRIHWTGHDFPEWS